MTRWLCMIVHWNTTLVVAAVLSVSLFAATALEHQQQQQGADSIADSPTQINHKNNYINIYNHSFGRHFKKTILTVGYLTAIKGELKDRQGLAISGALTMALDEINNDKNILPNVTLALRWSDTKGDTVVATRVMTEMICDGVATFFGPEGPCHVEAIVSQSRNIPMLAYKCSDNMASKIPTFARTEPPDTQVTKSVISLLNYYGWKKFSIIHEEAWLTVASLLKTQANKKNMTVNHCEKVIDNHKCCENSMECCRSGYWYTVIQKTMNHTRIYVFLGNPSSLVDMMASMDTMQLFSNGEYLVIFVDMLTYSPREAQKYLWKPDQQMKSCDQAETFKKRARSLLVVVSTPPTENYENFTEKVRTYNKMAPFKFTTPPLFNNFVKFVSIYAAYLYDSVKLYSWALDQLLRQDGRVLTDEVIFEVAQNGTAIIEAIIKNRTYQSVTGATIKIDQNGDSEGNFSVLALKTFESWRNENLACELQMIQVAHFQQGEDDFPEYKIINASIRIEWAGEEKPFDEPSCGFENEFCQKDSTHITSMVVAGVLGLLLFCVGVITMSIYRKWKIELEIEGLLWKIDAQEIRGFFNADIVSSPSKLSLISAQSYGSRCSNQVFTATGRFRGVTVRIKELKFSKKKDISRDIMKEMRLLRDLRHDNINSFIGACVEPMRILLVTDYCAKGSLYDIIENEDIKLDELFIASLVHDLIKGMSYIHDSAIGYHGNLKSSNCVVTSRWMLQVTDFGLHDLRQCAENESIGEHQLYRNLFWRAPELLRNPSVYGTQKGDVYAFAIILYEIVGRRGPFGQIGLEPKDIIRLVKGDNIFMMFNDGDVNSECGEGDSVDNTNNTTTVSSLAPSIKMPFRPDTEHIIDGGDIPDYVINCITDCWDEIAEQRPDFPSIRVRLKKMRGGKSKNIMDQMMEMMEKYANNLEDIVNDRTRLLCEEKRKTEDLLHRMLPQSVAEKLTMGQGVEPISYDAVTIYFSDIVGFTAMSAESTPLEVVNFLNDLYTVFDRIIKGYDVYKIETIGDAYMVVSGLPIKNDDRHVGEIASMSLELLQAVRTHRISHRPNEMLKLRIGMHTGPVVAGVVGLTMPRYCLFGDTVNTASRMESNGEPLRIHISPQCKESLDKLGGYITESRGLIKMKGKGDVLTYWLIGATDKAIQKQPVDFKDLPPPLFCRPRRSPKLNCDSRQPSLIGAYHFGGSRRQSSSSMLCGSYRDSPRLTKKKLIDRTPLYFNEESHTTTPEYCLKGVKCRHRTSLSCSVGGGSGTTGGCDDSSRGGPREENGYDQLQHERLSRPQKLQQSRSSMNEYGEFSSCCNNYQPQPRARATSMVPTQKDLISMEGSDDDDDGGETTPTNTMQHTTNSSTLRGTKSLDLFPAFHTSTTNDNSNQQQRKNIIDSCNNFQSQQNLQQQQQVQFTSTNSCSLEDERQQLSISSSQLLATSASSTAKISAPSKTINFNEHETTTTNYLPKIISTKTSAIAKSLLRNQLNQFTSTTTTNNPKPVGCNGSIKNLEDSSKCPLLMPTATENAMHSDACNTNHHDRMQLKKWRSLETVGRVSGADVSASTHSQSGSKKNLTKNSIKSFLVGLFNGNGYRASNSSLKKAIGQQNDAKDCGISGAQPSKHLNENLSVGAAETESIV